MADIIIWYIVIGSSSPTDSTVAKRIRYSSDNSQVTTGNNICSKALLGAYFSRRHFPPAACGSLGNLLC